MSLRVVFMGTPVFAVPVFMAIRAAGHNVVAAYSQPPRPAGRRGLEVVKSPIHVAAEAFGVPALTPINFRNEPDRHRFASHRADVAVVVAYGLILPVPILETPRYGCLNLHASALPRWRGAAPIQRAIMAGDQETAAAIMRMEQGLDTGPVCLTEPVGIAPDMTAGDLHDLLSERGAELMVEALAKLEESTLTCTPQSTDGLTYAAKIDKAESRIDFARPAIDVHNLVRGLSPIPGAWFQAAHEGKTERIKVLRSRLAAGTGPPGALLDSALTIACGADAVQILEVQRAGKRPTSALEFLRGFPLELGVSVNAGVP